MPFTFEGKTIDDYTIEGVDHGDCPDYCDAFVMEASFESRKLTDKELDRLNDDSQLLFEMLWESLN